MLCAKLENKKNVCVSSSQTDTAETCRALCDGADLCKLRHVGKQRHIIKGSFHFSSPGTPDTQTSGHCRTRSCPFLTVNSSRSVFIKSYFTCQDFGPGESTAKCDLIHCHRSEVKEENAHICFIDYKNDKIRKLQNKNKG